MPTILKNLSKYSKKKEVIDFDPQFFSDIATTSILYRHKAAVQKDALLYELCQKIIEYSISSKKSKG